MRKTARWRSISGSAITRRRTGIWPRAYLGFQQVLDQARFALARHYLRQDGLSLADISFLLGYQEQSAFNHAFKEWSGVNPGAWREGAQCRL